MDVNSISDDGSIHYGTWVGNCFLIVGRKQSHFPYQIMIGPHWPCMLVTYALVTVPTVLFLNNIAVLWGTPLVAATVFLLFVTLWLLSFAALSDPGIVYEQQGCVSTQNPKNGFCCSRTVSPYDTQTNQSVDAVVDAEAGTAVAAHNNEKMSIAAAATTIRCDVCNINRPLNASHCYECGVCIVNLDHHCPWTGKCVGEKTKKTLDKFVGMLAFLVLFVLLMVVISVMHDHYIFDFTNAEHFR